MPNITIYQYEISPYADKVRRVLKLKDLPYDTAEVLPSKAKKFRDVSPTLKFPAMHYDDQIIVDSTDIIKFLDEQHPEPKLIPEDKRDRALAHILEDWADESLYFFDLAIRAKPNNSALLAEDIARHETGLTHKLMMKLLPKGAQKIATTQGLGRKDSQTLSNEIREHFASLNVLLEGSDWLCGERISSADIAICSMIHVLIRAEEPAGFLPDFPRLKGLKARVDEITL